MCFNCVQYRRCMVTVKISYPLPPMQNEWGIAMGMRLDINYFQYTSGDQSCDKPSTSSRRTVDL